MSFYKAIVLVCFLLSQFTNGFTNVWTEDSLRNDILKLFQKKLQFSDETSPRYEGELDDITPENNTEYDFIVVGAGSAGATIASRLSEVEDFTVLLIEAGSKEYPFMDIPLMAPALQLNDQIDWHYKTESSDKYCIGMTDSKCKLPRGKVMGGSSILNYMVATRGNKQNYDEWAAMTGDESWSYENMLYYFKKLEDFNVRDVEFDSEMHNRGGPVHITTTSFSTPLEKAFIEGGKELGLPSGTEVDYNSRSQIGYSPFQYTIRNGERWSTNRAYLHPAKNRTNLFLTRDSYVSKVLIDEESITAFGVLFSKKGNEYVVKAKKEVIVSAGAINSPQLLMLSGIGPKKHLQELNIKVVKNAPVGENLVDHVGYCGMVFKTNISVNPIDVNILDPRNPAINNYVTNGDEVLASGPGFSGLAFLNVDKPKATDENPNVEFLLGISAGIQDPILAEIAGISDYYKNLLLVNETNYAYFNIWPVLTQPKSRGKILLQSNNPKDKPRIHSNFLDDPDDVRVIIKGIREAIKLSKTRSFANYDSKIVDLHICKDKEYDSDAFWECAVRTFTLSIYHQAGTCKMGRENDNTAVVNSRLKVIGVKNLRVADASVMPNIISGHPNIPIIAIAEKLADMVKEDWGICNCKKI